MTHAQDFVAAHARELLDGFADAVQVVSPEGVFLYVNRAWSGQLGYAEADALGLGFLDLIHPDHQAPWKSIFKAVLAGERIEHLEMVLITQAGAHLAVEGSVWVQEFDGEKHVCAMFRDTARHAAGEKQLAQLLYRDEETGLYNRRGFSVRSVPLFEILADNPERLGGWLMYIEATNIDQIARRHGDDAAVEALKRCAEILHKALRVHDVVARVGGASFAAMMTLPPRYQASYVVTRVRAALTHSNRQARRPYEIELAIGLAPVEPATTLDAAIETAAKQAIGAQGP